MSTFKKIIFQITKEGDVIQQDAIGYGSKCLEATQHLEQRLGQPLESTRQLTENYNEIQSNEIAINN